MAPNARFGYLIEPAQIISILIILGLLTFKFFLPHSRKVPGAAITRSGLVGILYLVLTLLLADEVLVIRLNGIVVVFFVFVPKLRIRVT